MQTLKEVAVLSRRVNRAINKEIEKPDSKRKQSRLGELQKIRTKVDRGITALNNRKPVRCSLPKKQQRKMGILPSL